MAERGPQVAGRRPDSVVVSLGELRRIEERRLDGERREEEERLVEAQRQKDEAARAAAAEEARRAAVEEERRRAEREREERLRLEERVRVAEAERRARVEAEMTLERQRIAVEMTARRPGRGPLLPLLGTGLVLAALGLPVLGLGWQQAASRATALAGDLQRLERRRIEEGVRLGGKVQVLETELAAQRSRLDGAHRLLLASHAELEELRKEAAKGGRKPKPHGTRPPAVPGTISLDCIHSSDPMCGEKSKK
jgi:hypothetical protein